MEEKQEFKHSWQSVPFHNVALYQCKYCGKYLERLTKESCSEAEQYLRREKEKLEKEEFEEYKRLCGERDRWEYLNTKYRAKIYGQ